MEGVNEGETRPVFRGRMEWQLEPSGLCQFSSRGGNHTSALGQWNRGEWEQAEIVGRGRKLAGLRRTLSVRHQLTKFSGLVYL